MTAHIIDGAEQARHLRKKIALEIAMLQGRYHVTPGIAVLLLGNDPASEIYVRNKIQACQEVGISCHPYYMDASISQAHLLKKIESLNNDPKIHGILIQLPLPAHINGRDVINTIDPLKDVDGFHIDNIGKLVTEQPDALIPCTPQGCMMLLQSLQRTVLPERLDGLKAIVLGRSNIVGRPMAQLLLQANCTVTMAHSYSRNIEEEVARSDIVVSAVGNPHMIKSSWIKPGAVILDVGMNRIHDSQGKARLVGDVAFDEVLPIAGAITPVPGGVGPMTIVCLLQNTLKATCLIRTIPIPGHDTSD